MARCQYAPEGLGLRMGPPLPAGGADTRQIEATPGREACQCAEAPSQFRRGIGLKRAAYNGASPTRVTVDAWLEHALLDATRRGLPALAPLLRALARATSELRAADWNDDAAGRGASPILNAR